tara:strand:- start:2913 stop:3377 length:465 start_codon:yes stop_codon:yes gene_type:complete
MNNKNYIDFAIQIAQKGENLKEVPVGAVIVDEKHQKIISARHNEIVLENNPLKHAEMLVINDACKIMKTRYLNNLTIYVTLEPCLMCAAAISEARIKKLYFGAYDEKKGAIENGIRFFTNKNYFKPQIYGGINEDKCSLILKNFFSLKRKKNNG